MDAAARIATPGDLAEVVRLARLVRAEVGEGRGGPLWVLEARAEPLERTLAEGALLLVGTYDDVIVGYASARLEAKRDGSTVALVDEVYVEPEAREVGVGEALLAELVAWAEGSGCRGIDAVVLPGLREGKNLFERFGMAARSITVHRSFGG